MPVRRAVVFYLPVKAATRQGRVGVVHPLRVVFMQKKSLQFLSAVSGVRGVWSVCRQASGVTPSFISGASVGDCSVVCHGVNVVWWRVVLGVSNVVCYGIVVG